MRHQVTILKNGVRVLVVPMPSLESATICVWVKTGSRYEDEKLNGISHFLEHMVFKGSTKYPSAKLVSEAIDTLGAQNNAGTSKEWTNFWIKTASINLEKAFDILSDVVLHPLLNKEELERERQVILQEMAMYDDTPLMSIGEHFEENIYSGTSLGWKIIGSQESLMNVNKDEFKKYRNDKYLPENVLISVTGGIKEERVKELTEKYFSELDKGRVKAEADTSYKFDKDAATEDKVTLKTKENADQAHFILGFRTDGRGYKGRFAQGVLSTILGRGMSSRLFTEVREKRGLAYSVHSSIDRYIGIGAFEVYAGVDIKKIEESVKVVLDQVFGVANKKYKLTDKELNKAKSYLKGKLALGLEDSGVVGDFFAEQELFNENIMTPKDIYKQVDAVNIDDLYKEAEKMFDKSGVYLSVIGPYTNKSKFEKLVL